MSTARSVAPLLDPVRRQLLGGCALAAAATGLAQSALARIPPPPRPPRRATPRKEA